MLIAYLDPGSGNLVAQAMVAGAAGAAVAAKLGWRRINSSVRKRKGQPPAVTRPSHEK